MSGKIYLGIAAVMVFLFVFINPLNIELFSIWNFTPMNIECIDQDSVRIVVGSSTIPFNPYDSNDPEYFVSIRSASSFQQALLSACPSFRDAHYNEIMSTIPGEIYDNNLHVAYYGVDVQLDPASIGVISNEFGIVFRPESGTDWCSYSQQCTESMGRPQCCYTNNAQLSGTFIYSYGEPPAQPECTTANDCIGKEHADCAGNWGCTNDECVWTCDTTPPPEPNPEQDDMALLYITLASIILIVVVIIYWRVFA